MAELPDELKEKINRCWAEADELFNNERFDEALLRYWSTWELFPEPRTAWPDAFYLLSGLGEAALCAGDFAAGRDAFLMAMKYDMAADHAYERLRLGHCLFELGERDAAAKWFTAAYLLEGKKFSLSMILNTGGSSRGG